MVTRQSRELPGGRARLGLQSLGMTQALLGAVGPRAAECLLPAGITVTDGGAARGGQPWLGRRPAWPPTLWTVLNTGDNDHSVRGRHCCAFTQIASSHAGLAAGCDFPCLTGEETEAQRGGPPGKWLCSDEWQAGAPGPSLMPGPCPLSPSGAPQPGRAASRRGCRWRPRPPVPTRPWCPWPEHS